ncbi:unnamed protein product, partial [Effrenium voratum]
LASNSWAKEKDRKRRLAGYHIKVGDRTMSEYGREVFRMKEEAAWIQPLQKLGWLMVEAPAVSESVRTISAGLGQSRLQQIWICKMLSDVEELLTMQLQPCQLRKGVEQEKGLLLRLQSRPKGGVLRRKLRSQKAAALAHQAGALVIIENPENSLMWLLDIGVSEVKKKTKRIMYGVFHTPDEFLERALELEHPFDCPDAVSRENRVAIQWVMSEEPELVAKCEQLAKGWLTGPYTEEQLDLRHGGTWSGKIRCIDDCSEFLVNSSTSVPEKLDLEAELLRVVVAKRCNAMLDTQFQMWNWYSRVPSASNPSDAASRLEFKGYDGWRKVTPDYSDHAA